MRLRINTSRRAVATRILTVLTVGLLCGCSARSFFDQSEVGVYPRKPLLVPILSNLDTGYEEGDERFATATNIRAKDLEVVETDYVVSPNDLLLISITDLLGQGVESFKQPRVSQTGYISLPYLNRIKASGLTEAQLEQAIADAYRDNNIIQRAQVSVSVQDARGRTFTLAGAVAAPGQYLIFDSNFRILDALALGRGVGSQGVDNIYVVRRLDQEPDAQEMAPELDPQPATRPAPDVLTPQSRAPESAAKRVAMLRTQPQDPQEAAATAQPTQPGEREGRIVIIDGKEVRVDGSQPEPEPMPEPMPGIVDADVPPSTQGFEFNELSEPGNVRVIRIPYDALQRGELKYNIVVRPQDMIIVPDPLIGEYYMGGHVQRTGAYSTTARNITLKQAVIAAGMLDQLAVPWRTSVTRRIGPNREITVSVNLTKIFAGQEPDIYLKPYDSVMVGTDFWAPFLAAARNGFRITYGFGFLYDRNYAPNENR